MPMTPLSELACLCFISRITIQCHGIVDISA
uniref:Uncharacterized protein n=1 Tax=Salmonella enteritidis TaxID=149539 RepID=T1PYC9_SALEN|nr:hypothetical protein pS1400_89_0130 [Salmonella enterica subsp. enterica serovar Enteritidis]